ncbi:MAG TPA: MoxR family ATPase [Planctomycetota bacterium]|nr:MoxR family ATPase [Planctomycetota bacterium]
MTHAPATVQRDTREQAADVCRVAAALREQVARRIVGLDETVEQVLIAVLTEQHALLEGVPGLAKTLLVSTVANLLDCTFRRIQFTPDLMPGDVTGGEVLGQDASGKRAFRFLPGPIFANVILADEINRTPPKTQAALMEAMEERQVTSLGVRRPLDRPFLVLATQNPIEQQGTYPLPIAQLDRFMFKIRLAYPTREQEARIVRLTTAALDPGPAAPVTSKAGLLGLQTVVANGDVATDLMRFAVDLVRASRPAEASAPPTVRDYVTWGAGPRAAQALIAGARARALLRGRPAPDADDVRALAPAVFRHRFVMSYAAEADGVTPDDVTRALFEAIPGPGGPPQKDEPHWVKRLWASLVGAGSP